jgi:sugar/nucleoside kinase (ribokinase family)
MGFLREQSITAIITLDKFGAVGNFKTGADGVMVVWPMIEDESKVADPTGTGDAFAAGVASVLSQKAEVSYPVFYEASRAGRLWAGYACTTVGGSAQSPSVSALADFEKTVTSKRAISVQPIGEAEPFIHLIDQANRA